MLDSRKGKIKIGHTQKCAVKKIVRVSTENICRICGKLSDSLVPIYNDKDKEKCLPVFIHQYLSIKVSETGVGWPKNICDLCIRCLLEWDELYNKCKQVDAMFGKLLNISKSSSLSSHNEPLNKSYKQKTFNKQSKPPDSHQDHNYCPSDNTDKPSGETDCCKQSNDINNPADLGTKSTNTDDQCLLHKKSASDVINRTCKESIDISCTMDSDNKENVDSSPGANNGKIDSGSGNEILSDKTSEKTNSGKHQYKIGITLVKNKDCKQGSELDFNSLKSILISKVNQLFQSICNDKALGNSLVNENRTCPNGDNSDTDVVVESHHEDKSLNDPIKEENVDDSDNISIVEESKTISDEIIHENEMSLKSNTESKERLFPQKRKKVIPDETGSYLCSDCGCLMTERKAFLTHRRMYHVEKKCHYCNETLSSLQDYKRHLRASHVDKMSNCCCELCGATFVRRERLQRHKLVIHNIGEYLYCDICNKKCASRQQLYCHKSDAHNKTNNLCHHCGQNFASHQSFVAHLKKKHSYKKNLSCTNCNKAFNTRSNLEIHIEKCQNVDNSTNNETRVKISPKIVSANSKLFTCLICNVKITDIEMLKQHMNYHAEDECIKNLVGQEEKTDYECTLCNQYYNTERDFALHRFYSHKEAPYICRVMDCNITFWKRMSLIVHQMTVHKMSNNYCKICSINFTDFREKRRHMKTQHSSSAPQEKPYVCTLCNRRFCWLSTLKTHMVTHSDVKSHKCDLCGKEFKLKLTLSKHMQYHERRSLIEEELKGDAIEITEVTGTDVTGTTEITTITDVVEQIDTESEPKQLFTVGNDEQELTVMSTTGLVKICTVFKCPECSILFTHKETLDSHFLEEHADKQSYGIEVINVNINENEFV